MLAQAAVKPVYSGHCVKQKHALCIKQLFSLIATDFVAHE